MGNNEKVRQNLENISLYEKEVYISAMSYYEMKRGLLAKDATRKLDIFEKICKEIRILFGFFKSKRCHCGELAQNGIRFYVLGFNQTSVPMVAHTTNDYDSFSIPINDKRQ